jgi:hypothetical protein
MALDVQSSFPEERMSTIRSWTSLLTEDRRAYATMREQFQGRRPAEKFQNAMLFRTEIQSIIEFIERSPIGREHRSIVCGLASAGPFVTVNTRQLKALIGRCKSSINGSFQSLGYLAVKTRSKARECVLAILPSLKLDRGAARQWTVRFNRAIRAPGFQIIAEDDLRPDEPKRRALAAQKEAASEENIFLWLAQQPTAGRSRALSFGWSEDDLSM